MQTKFYEKTEYDRKAYTAFKMFDFIVYPSWQAFIIQSLIENVHVMIHYKLSMKIGHRLSLLEKASRKP